MVVVAAPLVVRDEHERVRRGSGTASTRSHEPRDEGDPCAQGHVRARGAPSCSSMAFTNETAGRPPWSSAVLEGREVLHGRGIVARRRVVLERHVARIERARVERQEERAVVRLGRAGRAVGLLHGRVPLGVERPRDRRRRQEIAEGRARERTALEADSTPHPIPTAPCGAVDVVGEHEPRAREVHVVRVALADDRLEVAVRQRAGRLRGSSRGPNTAGSTSATLRGSPQPFRPAPARWRTCPSAPPFISAVSQAGVVRRVVAAHLGVGRAPSARSRRDRSPASPRSTPGRRCTSGSSRRAPCTSRRSGRRRCGSPG